MIDPPLESIRACLEGVVPSLVATCDADGAPNVTYVSHVHYVDRSHVALSFQFFNKTRANILTNPRAAVFLVDPYTAARYVLHVRYLRTEADGPLFERMKAYLAGIASHTGMAAVFKLQGSDVYEVLEIEHLVGPEMPAPAQRSWSACGGACGLGPAGRGHRPAHGARRRAGGARFRSRHRRIRWCC